MRDNILMVRYHTTRSYTKEPDHITVCCTPFCEHDHIGRYYAKLLEEYKGLEDE